MQDNKCQLTIVCMVYDLASFSIFVTIAEVDLFYFVAFSDKVKNETRTTNIKHKAPGMCG